MKRRATLLIAGAVVLSGLGLVAARAGLRDPGKDPNVVVDLPTQPVNYHSQADHNPSRGEWMHISDLVVTGRVEDFAVYRASEEAEVPAGIKRHNDVQAGLHFARWRIRVEDRIKGAGPTVINIISGDFSPIVNNSHRNPWLEGEIYRFYLSQNFLEGNFYFVNYAEEADASVPTPDSGPIVFDAEGDDV